MFGSSPVGWRWTNVSKVLSSCGRYGMRSLQWPTARVVKLVFNCMPGGEIANLSFENMGSYVSRRDLRVFPRRISSYLGKVRVLEFARKTGLPQRKTSKRATLDAGRNVVRYTLRLQFGVSILVKGKSIQRHPSGAPRDIRAGVDKQDVWALAAEEMDNADPEQRRAIAAVYMKLGTRSE